VIDVVFEVAPVPFQTLELVATPIESLLANSHQRAAQIVSTNYCAATSFGALPNCSGSRCCSVVRSEILPNKSLQPTATAVMPPAAQEIMPAVAVAEH
jgi:hypothetical protein